MEKSEQRNLKDWNQLLNFLAAPEEGNFEELTAPTLILAGNCLPILADKAAQMYLNGQVDQLFLVGGWGMRLESFMRILKSKDFILKMA